ncbi:FG-GAP repeat protein, partial [Xanthovirga aplysinae]|uniref:FG-GAP repeat protein n=1 Tax=Xanthovirga aplysinae TaxID=2529853 RepID=UPI0016574928
SGNQVVVGAPYKDNKTGLVYVFEKPDGGWTDMSETTKLSAYDGAANDRFGWSVSISGNQIVIGAPVTEINGSSSGSVYLFEKSAGSWSGINETAKVIASDGTHIFGYSVRISDDQIVAGASSGGHINGYPTGIAYVFEKPAKGWSNMSETAILRASDGNGYDFFGSSVGVSGDQILIGAPYEESEGNGSGSVYVFEKPLEGWSDTNEKQKIPVPPFFSNNHDQYGRLVSVDGDYAVVGGIQRGYVLLFWYNGGSWEKLARLTASDSSWSRYFGCSVSISGDQVVVMGWTDFPMAYVFEKPSGGWSDMSETAKLSVSDFKPYATNFFDFSVSILGDQVVVGAPKDENGGANSGSVYVFEKSTKGWQDMKETAKLVPSNGSISGGFGCSVSISGDQLVVGAQLSDNGKRDTGLAYVFVKPDDGWTNMYETAQLQPSESFEDAYFGKSVSISGNQVMVGTPSEKHNSYQMGSVYYFEKPLEGWSDMRETDKLKISENTQYYNFGGSLSISANKVAVGAVSVANGEWSSSVYVFEKRSENWSDNSEITRIATSDGTSQDDFGFPLSISGDHLVVGAPLKNNNDFHSGAVYFYKRCVLELQQPDDQVLLDDINCPIPLPDFSALVNASSNCGEEFIYEQSPAVGTPIDRPTKVKIIVTDEGGDSDYREFIVNVIDEEAPMPVLESLPTISADCSMEMPQAPEAVDNCSGTIIGVTDTTLFPITTEGTSEIIWKYTDENGNSSTQSQKVIITGINDNVSQNGDVLIADAVGFNYQWLDCNNNNSPIIGATYQNFTPAENGSYAVEISNGTCKVTSICINYLILGSENTEVLDGLKIYPNPTQDRFQIDKGPYTEITIRVLDVHGKELI